MKLSELAVPATDLYLSVSGSIVEFMLKFSPTLRVGRGVDNPKSGFTTATLFGLPMLWLLPKSMNS